MRKDPARAAEIRPPGAAITTGAPVVADLDGDGRPEVVVTDLVGNVWAWDHDGHRRAGFSPTTIGGRRESQVHIDPAFSNDNPATGKNNFNRTKRGIAAAPSVGDLDGDGRLEIVVAALDRHVYAWHDDGTPVAGFPVLLVDPAKVAAVDPTTNYVTFTPAADARKGGELITTPTLGDLTGDGRPEIVVGAQEEYAEPANIGSGSVASPDGRRVRGDQRSRGKRIPPQSLADCQRSAASIWSRPSSGSIAGTPKGSHRWCTASGTRSPSRRSSKRSGTTASPAMS